MTECSLSAFCAYHTTKPSASTETSPDHAFPSPPCSDPPRSVEYTNVATSHVGFAPYRWCPSLPYLTSNAGTPVAPTRSVPLYTAVALAHAVVYAPPSVSAVELGKPVPLVMVAATSPTRTATATSCRP